VYAGRKPTSFIQRTPVVYYDCGNSCEVAMAVWLWIFIEDFKGYLPNNELILVFTFFFFFLEKKEKKKEN
jgi:hypothetical protein